MRSHLSEPPEDLTGFPERVLPVGTELWLAHAADRWPWICDCGDGARFTLDAPWGTCHLALDPLAALVECCCRDAPSIDAETALAHRLSVLSTDRPLRLADMTDARAFGWGVTAEVHSTPDYTVTRRWAAAAHRAGLDGICYLVRHDPSQRLVAVALFGPAGERRDWAPPRTQPLTAALLADAERRLGIRVAPATWEAAG